VLRGRSIVTASTVPVSIKTGLAGGAFSAAIFSALFEDSEFVGSDEGPRLLHPIRVIRMPTARHRVIANFRMRTPVRS
jgi:hypothetical protein